eukprot:gene21246-27529_t
MNFLSKRSSLSNKSISKSTDVLNGKDNESNTVTTTGLEWDDNNSSSVPTNKPQRVCDVCYKLLTKKNQLKLQANSIREREQQLLNATSQVSDCLVKVFFLDGSYKTLAYDSTTTAQSITNMLEEGLGMTGSWIKPLMSELLENFIACKKDSLLLP